MAVVNDLVSLENFIKALFPGSKTEKQTVPLKLATNTFVVRLQSASTESETAKHFRIDRDYQVVYFGTTAADVLAKMDTLITALNQTLLIPIASTLRYIRVNDVSYGAPFKTDNDLYAAIAVISTEVRQARAQQQYEKIAHVYAQITAK